MRVSYTSPFTGITTTSWMSLEELTYKKEVAEIENEKFEMEKRRVEQTYPPTALNSLSGTESFTNSATNHIFKGVVNKQGLATGYHYEGIEPTGGRVIPGTKTLPDKYGVYKAKVSVNGIIKTNRSTFFPRDWTPQQVVNAINEAYANRSFVTGSFNEYSGRTSNGMSITMYLNKNGKIVSAFPE